jgi:hypothetical protein
MEWQPIETAPKDGRHILVRGGQADKTLCTVAHWHQDGFYLSWCNWDEDADYMMSAITHWCLIPEFVVKG